MLRQQARLRREYLYRKALEAKERAIAESKEKVQAAIEDGRPIPNELRASALQLQQAADWDDEGAEDCKTHYDDEYRWAGVVDPKILITTCKDPSGRLKQFVKEVRLMLPNAQRMNRGNYELAQIMETCRANEVTDVIIITETRGEPDGFTVCHLPFGPTAYFTITNTVMRHEIPDIGTMSEAHPHLIFHNFKSRLGQRVMNILKYLFPVPKDDSRRVVTFANQDDYISFRHHTYNLIEGKQVELKEVGPRFELKIYLIKLGTIEQRGAADTEWALRPYMNTTKKRKFLSDTPAFES